MRRCRSEKIAEHSDPVNWTFTNHYMGTVVRGGERKLVRQRFASVAGPVSTG